MTCLVYAVAPTRAIGLSFMEQCGVAVQDETTGQLRVTTQAVISTNDMRDGPGNGWSVQYLTGNTVQDINGNDVPETAARPEYYVNIRYYGDAEAMLAEGGDPTSEDLFERFPGLLLLSEARTGKAMVWTALSSDPIPPGYQNESWIRLYDPSLIVTPANVWA